MTILVCILLLFLEFFIPFENFTLIWRRHHCWWRAANNFDLCLALMAIEQWGFFNMPHLLWHGPSLYNGHPRGPVTLNTYCQAFSSGAVTTCFTTSCLSWLEFVHPTFLLWGQCSNPLLLRRKNLCGSRYQNGSIVDRIALPFQTPVDYVKKFLKQWSWNVVVQWKPERIKSVLSQPE